MAYTEAQWNKFQASLPPEDRVSYAEYISKTGGTLQQFKTKEAADLAKVPKPSISAIENTAVENAKKAAAAKSALTTSDALTSPVGIDDPRYYTAKVGSTGKTSAQLAALENATNTASTINTNVPGAIASVNQGTGKVVNQKLPEGFNPGKFPTELEKYFGVNPDNIAGWKITPYTNSAGETYYKLSISQKGAYGDAISGSSEFGAPLSKDSSGKWIVFQGDYSTGSNIGGDSNTSNTSNTSSSGTDSATLSLIKSLQAQIASLTAGNNTAAALAAAEKKAAAETTRKNAIDVLTERFQRYGLGSLVNKIKELAIDGATEATITLGLQETEEYKTRFKANQERIKKGLAVLNPAEYLNVEDGYRQVLRAYGLKQFDTDDYVSQFIANDVSAAELSNRVVTAVQRVQNADPAISKQLRDYYGIGQADLVAYVLDPNQQFQKIERQVAASEIGVAAARQGLQAGVSVAEQLAAQGVTQAEAQKGYATIADILPTAEKLSDIYGSTLDGYGQTEAEQEVFNSLASAQRKRQKLTQREIASFSGAAGTNRTSLTQQTVGQY
jgi:hypothetical protein